MKKKYRVKSQVWYTLVIIIFLIIGGIYGYKKYQEYQYHKTYEYKLTEMGYPLEDAQLFNEKLDSKDLDYILSIRKDNTIASILKEKYFIKAKFQEYYNYHLENKKEDITKVVAIINSKVDHEYYSLSLKTDMSKGDAIIVNKYYTLANDYVPDDLVKVPMDYAWGEYGSIVVRQVAYDAFLNMWQAAQAEGYYLMISSAFRTFQEQEIVFNNYKNSYGEDYALSIAAKPGYSEHQTGLALDIFTKTNSNRTTFKDSEAAKWLANNAYKFGFILRYPSDKVDLTGYSYEAWHFRYVGKDIAKYIYENKITFEEYYAYFLDN